MPSESAKTARPSAPQLPSGIDRRLRPRLRVRLRASLRAAELDEQLAIGVDPLCSDLLLWRAQQLVEPDERAGFAKSLETIVNEIDRGGPHRLAGPQTLCRDLVKDNRSLLLVLAERLRADGPHGLRGLAMADLLVHYRDSALYRAQSPLQLKWKLLEVLAALEPKFP
jgi:hypothetical protein